MLAIGSPWSVGELARTHSDRNKLNDRCNLIILDFSDFWITSIARQNRGATLSLLLLVCNSE
jgi:hypothetical protein